MASLADLSQTKIETLKKGGYNLRAAELVVTSIFNEIKEGKITWEDLNTNKDEIDRSLLLVLKKDFLNLFLKYLNNELELDDLEYHFSLIDQAIKRSQLSFSELRPFAAEHFFKFRAHFKAKCDVEQNN